MLDASTLIKTVKLHQVLMVAKNVSNLVITECIYAYVRYAVMSVGVILLKTDRLLNIFMKQSTR